MLKVNIIIFILYFIPFYGQKTYVKNYNQNRIIKSEGWILKNEKTDYWYFYNENGTIKEEGHFYKNKKIKWWTFYNDAKEIIKKCEFKNNVMDGYCIIYTDGKISKAEKYKMGKKIKEYYSIEEFKKDNLLSYSQ